MLLQKIALGEVAVFVNTSQKILVWLECTKDQLNRRSMQRSGF